MQTGLTGNLTRDPQVTETEKGTVVRVVVASSPRWRDRAGKFQTGETVFTRVEWWGSRAAAFAQRAHKGTAVVVLGEWRAATWTTQEGEKHRRQWVAAEVVGVVPASDRAGHDDEPAPDAETAPAPAAEKAQTGGDDFWDEAQ